MLKQAMLVTKKLFIAWRKFIEHSVPNYNNNNNLINDFYIALNLEALSTLQINTVFF